jgi:hypothetical protein
MNRAHNSVIQILNKNKIDWQNKPLISPLQGAMDMDMVKDMDKDKDMVKDKGGFDLSFVDPALAQSYTDFLTMRVEIKKPFRSQLSIEANYKQLIKISNNNIGTAKEIVLQSIAHQWQGFFELKTNTNYGTKNGKNTNTTGFHFQPGGAGAF